MNWTVRSPLLGLLVIASLVFGIERLIVTASERIERVAKDCGAAIQAQDWERLEGLLHEDFEYEGRDRAATIAHVRSLVRKYKPTEIVISVHEVEVDDGKAKSQGVVKGSAMGRPARVPVQAWFRETDDGWKLWKVQGGSYVK